MKRYEGLFILNTAAKEESINDVIGKISEEIKSAGGKVETVQKMEKKTFTRVADRKHTAGFYVNVIFETKPASLEALRTRFNSSDDIFRVIFTNAPAPKDEETEK